MLYLGIIAHNFRIVKGFLKIFFGDRGIGAYKRLYRDVEGAVPYRSAARIYADREIGAYYRL